MRKRNKRQFRKSGPRFVQLHHYLLESAAYLSLSHVSRAALIEVAKLYNGVNNGKLAMSVRSLAERLNCSKDTAARALAELEAKGFIETTKVGSFRRRDRLASEYRLTFYRDDVSFQAPSKKFMHWTPDARSEIRPATVRSEGPTQQNCRSRSDDGDRQGEKTENLGPTTGTHIEYNHGG